MECQIKKLFFTISVLIILTTVLHSQWTDIILSPRPPALISAYAYNTNIAYVCGDSGKVYYTSNSGTNWLDRSSSLFNFLPVYSVHATSAADVICINNLSGAGRIIRSTNAGVTWSPVFGVLGVHLNDLDFINASTGYAYGNPRLNRWFVIKTTDGGNSWDSTLPRPLADSQNDAGFPNALTAIQFGQAYIWFGTSAMKIFYSTDGGISWNAGSTAPSQPSFAITFLNQNTGFAGGMIGFKSTTSGSIWQQWPPVQSTGPVYSFVNAAGIIWYCTGPNIYCSTDGGFTFFLQHVSPSGQPYRHLSMTLSLSDNSMSIITGWGVTNDGVISHYTETVGIKKIGNSIPESFNLEQNYPNPFNPKSKIKFQISKLSKAKLIVYDISGEEIQTLVSEELSPGTYEVDWDASNFPSGIYFCKLRAGDYIQTRKMILVK